MSSPAWWQVTADCLAEGDEETRIGHASGARPAGDAPVRWRVLDDDGVTYYQGVATTAALEVEEDAPGSLYGALEWAAADAGAVRLDVRQGDAWRTVFA